MGTKVFEGNISRTSNAIIVNGRLTKYEFIEIGGQRVMKVQADSLLDTFIKVGDDVGLSCVKVMGGVHKVCAVRESDGRITKMEGSVPVLAAIVAFGLWVFLLAFIFMFAVFFMPTALAILLWLGLPALFAYFHTVDYFKARNAFDDVSPKAAPTKEW
ncbi:hypothetical protein ICY20_21955 [Pseudomonas sp. P115]|uniref:hypothetical protein n=1 Tax=Pseudomonas pisciculturae TaxID=2730413 RepID=UPI001356D3FB|nr:hypothetical protein [Pseudomonas pisciculturae]MBF6030420.1 hypothetical protein [Pseudomonas pisciculturae]